MKKITTLLFTAVIMFTACKKNDNNKPNGVFTSKEVTLFQGKAKTWISLNNGVPKQLAISINDSAMNSLPADGESEYETLISLSPEASSTAFDHVAVDWNPHGHEPDGVYSFPHFDFHFYMISTAEQTIIRTYEQDSAKFLNFPDSQYMPVNYVPIPGGVPMMGTHWVDFTSPELNGQQFTQTFIYGSYNGNVNFYEPMITSAFLSTTTTFERPIPQPASVKKSAYYPTKLKVSKHNGVTEIILDSFIYKQKS